MVSSRKKLGKYMVKFKQYITAFNIANLNSKHKIRNPKIQQVQYPKRILPYIEDVLFKTQKMLSERTDDFYKNLDEEPNSNCFNCFN